MMSLQLKSKTYKAVIFDFNGVLLLDSEWHEQAWKETIEELTGSACELSDIQKLIHGRINKDIFEIMLNRSLAADEVVELSELKETKYRIRAKQAGADFCLAPGVEALLNRLTDASIPIAIATASCIRNMSFFYQELNLERWFNWQHIAYADGDIKGKPAPDLYLKAAHLIETSPQEVIVFEDSIAGMQSAKNAQAGLVVAVLSTINDRTKVLQYSDLQILNLLEFEAHHWLPLQTQVTSI